MQIQQANGLSYVVFSPEQLGLYFSEANASGQLARSRANEVLALPGVLAVLDGPMFTDCSSTGHCTRPARQSCSPGHCNAVLLDYLYLDRRGGEFYEGRHPNRGMTLSVDADGHTYAMHGGSAAGNPVVAVQLYPELIWDGRNVASTSVDTSTVWRAALGVLPGGKMVLAISRAPMHAFAEKLRALGVTYAGYTDGGGSTSLQLIGQPRIGSTEDRAVASWIVIRKPAPSSTQGSSLAFLDRLTHGATGFSLFESL